MGFRDDMKAKQGLQNNQRKKLVNNISSNSNKMIDLSVLDSIVEIFMSGMSSKINNRNFYRGDIFSGCHYNYDYQVTIDYRSVDDGGIPQFSNNIICLYCLEDVDRVFSQLESRLLNEFDKVECYTLDWKKAFVNSHQLINYIKGEIIKGYNNRLKNNMNYNSIKFSFTIRVFIKCNGKGDIK